MCTKGETLILKRLEGKLEKGAVMKAICVGFEETTKPVVLFEQWMHFMGEYVNAPWWMMYNSKEMVIKPVKLVDLGDARLTMEVVGMKPGMDMNRIMEGSNANVLQALKVMV
ncbi:hypothetical protein RJT34_30681 [Clitoria ternatea]|uniref:Uncharacterized protein n=1 Tax=Clitoria ternatea TaxID=43366 RepID=A0AAN9ETA0_CLITE